MVFYKYFILMKSVVELYFQLRSDFRVHFDTQSKQPASGKNSYGKQSSSKIIRLKS